MILGPTGRNFAAGMSGGIAYVLDEDNTFKSRCNLAMVELEPLPEEEDVNEKSYHHLRDLTAHGRVEVMSDMTARDARRLHWMISQHARHTGSKRAQEILANWKNFLPKFKKVMPTEYRRALKELKAEEAETPRLARMEEGHVRSRLRRRRNAPEPCLISGTTRSSATATTWLSTANHHCI